MQYVIHTVAGGNVTTEESLKPWSAGPSGRCRNVQTMDWFQFEWRDDPLSLYLSLKDNQDERVEAALEEMLGRLKW